ncbi:uncharacterized protein FIBRA_07226 [Fibroporia radiculosa]|uniref:Aminoglycoside phosphotransferase domain-containing protein n=1 Tax=Fibroporia radiculosa TaxID=599839 RepID=J4IBP6_9APHY|nr:uncharacterized protein FIBRA_07226 [Fibroporia radiculosa]CCM05026.1 predicted protein [Fibroporia radiculosa]
MSVVATTIAPPREMPLFVVAATQILFLDDEKVLKMMPLVVDVKKIVDFMRSAGEVVPVPRVFEYRYSGNCSYMVMEQRPGYTLGDSSAKHGLSHNDLTPGNILVNDDWSIDAIIDWDRCDTVGRSAEYEKMICRPYDPDYQHIFLRSSVDRLGSLSLNPVDGGPKCLSHFDFPLPRPYGSPAITADLAAPSTLADVHEGLRLPDSSMNSLRFAVIYFSGTMVFPSTSKPLSWTSYCMVLSVAHRSARYSPKRA